MGDGYVKDRLGSFGLSDAGAPEQERRLALNGACKKARARLYSGEIALDTAQRACSLAVKGRPSGEWRAALDEYESAIAQYVTAAETLPASPKE